MPQKKPSNKIEVDLKLLQDKNAEKLVAFGNKFDLSIDKLKTALDTYAGQLAGAAGMTGGGTTQTGKSKTASVASPLDGSSGRRAGRGTGGLLPPAGENYGWDNLGGSASVAPSSGGTGQGEGSLEQQYVRAQKRIGGVPVGLRQTLGYMAEGELQLNPLAFMRRKDEDEKKQNLSGSQFISRRVSEAMFTGEALRANSNLLQQQMHAANEFTNYGMDVGLSRQGVAGLPFGLGSAAMREGVKTNLKAMWSSKFGFNPNYSNAQSKHAMNTLNKMGYTGDTRDMMADQLKEWEIHQRLSPEAAMRVYDPAMRFGNTELSMLGQTISNLPAQARAAHMNLKEFGEQITTLAADLSRSGPGTAGGYMGQLSAFSATTGISPDKGAAMLQSERQTFMAMGLTGSSYAKATIGPTALSMRLKAPMMVGNNIAQSYGFKDMGALSKVYADMQAGREVSPAGDAALSSLAMMIERNPELFGGMTLPELMSNSRRKNVLGKATALSKLNALGERATDADYRNMIKVGGLGKRGIHGYEVDRAAFMKKGLVKQEADFVMENGEFKTDEARQAFRKKAISEHERKYINSALTKKAGGDTSKSKQTLIGLSPEASRYFKILDKQQPKQDSNSHTDAGAYSNYAMPPGRFGSAAGGVRDG